MPLMFYNLQQNKERYLSHNVSHDLRGDFLILSDDRKTHLSAMFVNVDILDDSERDDITGKTGILNAL